MFTCCPHHGMSVVRERVWGTLGKFLKDVTVGDTVSALEEAQIAARADPKKEKKRLQREADRLALREHNDLRAWRQLTDRGYQMRLAASAARASKRAAMLTAQRAQGIRLVNSIFEVMTTHPEGWSMMVGMPSSKVMEVLRALPDFSAKFSGSVSAEIKRLHRAIGMSTWEIVMAHNVAAGAHRESTIPEFLAGADPAVEASLFQESLEGPPRWAPRRTLTGPRFRQAKISSWALLPADADAVLDALEYDEDIVAAEAATEYDRLLAEHSRPATPSCTKWSRPLKVGLVPATSIGGRPGVEESSPDVLGLNLPGLSISPGPLPSLPPAPLAAKVHPCWVHVPLTIKTPPLLVLGSPTSTPMAVEAIKTTIARPAATVPLGKRSPTLVKACVATPVPAVMPFGVPSRFSVLDLDPVPTHVAGPRDHLRRRASSEAVLIASSTRKSLRVKGSPMFRDRTDDPLRPAAPLSPVAARDTQYISYTRLSPPPRERIPFTKKFRIRPPDPPAATEEAGMAIWSSDSMNIVQDSVSYAAENSTGAVDLSCGNTTVSRWRAGRWSITEHIPRAGQWALSRYVSSEELARNSDLIEGSGLCGYLALEWASRVGFEADPISLSLRDQDSLEAMVVFLTRVAIGTSGQVKSKLSNVLRHLQESATPWLSVRSDGMWLDSSDISVMNIWFPLVVWGPDVGDGWRRVMYPPHSQATEENFVGLTRVEAQIVLDCEHFHPLDPTYDPVRELCGRAGLPGPVDAELRGSVRVSGVSPAKRGGSPMGLYCSGIFHSAVRVSGGTLSESQTRGTPPSGGVSPRDLSVGQDLSSWAARVALNPVDPDPPD